MRQRVRAAPVSPGERHSEPPCIVHADHAGVVVLVVEQGRDEADGGAGGEEEDDAVTLVPRLLQCLLQFSLIEAGVGPRAFEVGGVTAAVRGSRDEPDHCFLPETTKTGVSAARRCRESATPFTREACKRVVSTSRPQSARISPAGTTRSRVMRLTTTDRRALTAHSLTISSKLPPDPPMNTASGSGRPRSAPGASLSKTRTQAP